MEINTELMSISDRKAAEIQNKVWGKREHFLNNLLMFLKLITLFLSLKNNGGELVLLRQELDKCGSGMSP